MRSKTTNSTRKSKFINVEAVTKRGGCKPGGVAYFRNTATGRKAAQRHAARLEEWIDKKGLGRQWMVITRSLSATEVRLLGLR